MTTTVPTTTAPTAYCPAGPTLDPCPSCDHLAPVQFRRRGTELDMWCSYCGHDYEATQP